VIELVGMRIIPLSGIGEIVAGDDLAIVLQAALDRQHLILERDDILVVTQKVVSKAEGRSVDLGSIEPTNRAKELAETTRKDPRLVELVLSESTAVLRAVPNVLITRHRLGLVMANAGIDRSNLGSDGDHALLLPIDPDASAARLSETLACAVVISDSFGRPWRLGVTAVGIGAAGIPALLDRRGELDRDGRVLEVTQVAVADLLACAAALVAGEGNESIPAVLLRGLSISGPLRPATTLNRPLEEDLFQ
jgi:coenzyme F420-0:L-glutamate ligase/coenzyme F420-1:gamma-L-glutamate ligase